MKKLNVILVTLCLMVIGTFGNVSTANAQFLDPGQVCTCPMIYAPVCTYDGNEYDNSCLAECDGYTEDEYERCGAIFPTASTQAKAAVWPPYACPDVYDPVCTYDGKRFGNACYAGLAGYSSNEYYKCGGAVE
ncbi:MAG: Kazal-type serine protease inhibitor family protein [Cyclobacteriaceae bacterium]